jgi:hypothetical protein
VAVPSDRTVIQETGKKLKYKYLSIEILRKLNMKCFVYTQIITGTIGIVTKGLKNIWKQYQESIQQILYKRQSY